MHVGGVYTIGFMDSLTQKNIAAGIRYNGIATGAGLILTLCMLPFIGAAVGFYYISRAKAAGNPAIAGRIVFFINIVLTIALAMVAWQWWEVAQQIQQLPSP